MRRTPFPYPDSLFAGPVPGPQPRSVAKCSRIPSQPSSSRSSTSSKPSCPS
nr:MAG TPA_asm: hypothetical protein [Caudoviricetes sp.]